MNKEYQAWLSQIKYKVQQAQLRAAQNFNIVLIELYWELGSEIVVRQKDFKWGDTFFNSLRLT